MQEQYIKEQDMHFTPLPEILYKYVSAERALSCIPEIGNGTLRATQPPALNDPFEFKVKMGVNEENKENTNEFLAENLSNIFTDLDVTPGQVAEARRNFPRYYIGLLIRDLLSRKIGVISFSEEHLHQLMWSHYAEEGRGFVIGLDPQKLYDLWPTLKKVGYGHMPDIFGGSAKLTEKQLVDIIYSKGSVWKYEKEWRLSVNLNETIGTGKKDDQEQPINLIRIPKEAVIKIYRTELTPETIVDEISNRLQNNEYRTKEVTKLVLSKEAYAYEEENQDRGNNQ